MGHTDVVGAQKEKWTFDPFTPTRKDGFIYARGATDDKDNRHRRTDADDPAEALDT